MNKENIEFIQKSDGLGFEINNETIDFFIKLNKEFNSNQIKSIINNESIDFLNNVGSYRNRFIEIIKGLNVEQINSITKYRNIMDLVFDNNFSDNWKPEERVLLFNEKNNNILSKINYYDLLSLIKDWKAEQVISLMNKFELDFFNNQIHLNFSKIVQLLEKLTPEETISIINNKNTNFLLKCLKEKDLNSFNFLKKLEKNKILSILNSDNPQEVLDKFIKEPLPEASLGSKIQKLIKKTNEYWESKKELIKPELIKNVKPIGIAGVGSVIVLIGGIYYLKNNDTGKLERKLTENEKQEIENKIKNKENNEKIINLNLEKIKKDNNIEINMQNQEDNLNQNNNNNFYTKFPTKELAIAGLGSAGLYGGYRLYNQYKKENKNKKYKSFAHFGMAKFKNLIKKIF